MKVTMTVNGASRSGEVEGRTLLVNFLRDTLHLTGTHVGCDTSQCGACVVHVNGKAVNIASYRVNEGDIIEVRQKSKQMAAITEALALAERDIPDYIEVDQSKLTVKFVRTPSLSDVPYPVKMEPNLIVEYYAKN